VSNHLKKILALSSSRAGDSGYLEQALPYIKNLLGPDAKQIAFIPFAAVTFSPESYAESVRVALGSLPHQIVMVTPENAKDSIKNADAIMVGGGNTFKLLHDLFKCKLHDLIRDKVSNGTPYIGWSAGSNILAPGIGTTNDMPVVEPESFNALGLFPFQINPLYNNALPVGHRGETRDQRLEEFVLLNPGLPVIGLPEGAAIQMMNGVLELLGPPGAFLFETGTDGMVKKELAPGEVLTHLL
jgi:dipeptidase E